MFTDDIQFSKWVSSKKNLLDYYRYEKFGNHCFIFRICHSMVSSDIWLVLEDEQTRKEISLGSFKKFDPTNPDCEINKTVTKLTKLFNDIVPW